MWPIVYNRLIIKEAGGFVPTAAGSNAELNVNTLKLNTKSIKIRRIFLRLDETTLIHHRRPFKFSRNFKIGAQMRTEIDPLWIALSVNKVIWIDLTVNKASHS
jgi:hypothetical protein